MHSIFKQVAWWFALAGGLAASGLALMTVASIGGRAALASPVPGDVELMQLGIAVTISLCLPLCQLQRANIIVDFFTSRLSPRAQQLLDGLGACLLAVMCVLLAWRTTVGALAVRSADEQTMILGLPGWWAYAMLAPGLLLTAMIGLWQGLRDLRGLPRPHTETAPGAPG